ncbi:PREDICTED: beta-glucosidase 33-like [Tarenaya hassleriana]|uniref:beta-glucosidase 33-like n=1 Tax=Tarenaya hassleriana TaxID=28532 RepID=UPI00053C1708|nr:PREDICTED: beta-glucosidase 33-like [Tarenaya hassleriana]
MKRSTTLSLLLGLLALLSFLSLTGARPHRHFDEEELGIVLGPHEFPDDDNTEDDDLGDIIGPHEVEVKRSDFPDDFIFGTSVSAYQVEGAKKGAGRGMTTWDQFTHMYADKVQNNSDGDMGVDFINRYKEDIQLMKELRTNGFRFSISWTRVLPYGRVSNGVNEKGVQFYNDLINELLDNGIQPAITLFHWESPLALETEYNGFLSKDIVKDFRDFARFCFQRFGDRVKNWATFNEPSVYSVAGYSKGKKAPGRCSPWENDLCMTGDSSREAYITAHNQILAHVAAVDEFRKCDKCEGGKIGIVLVSHWYEPKDPNSEDDKKSARRSLDFQLGWFLDPLTRGEYPEVMKEDVGERLPKFTPEESKVLKEKCYLDFVGLNYYGAFFVTANDKVNISKLSYAADLATNFTTEQKESPHLKASSMGIVVYPLGLRRVLKHIKDYYNDPEIYIMENGLDEMDDGQKSLEEALNDKGRKEFLNSHILMMGKAIRFDEVRVKGYFVWSLMDNFEWDRGYRVRFGLYYVDYNDDMKRHMRSSGEWLRKFLDTDMTISVCYFESHRAKGYAPKLFDREFTEYVTEPMTYASDFI